MREILHFPQMDKDKLNVVKELIDCIAEPGNEDCSSKLAELERITGKKHEELEFAEYWGWTDLDALAEKTLCPSPPCVQELTQEEIEEMVAIIRECLVIGEEARADYYMELLHKSLALTNICKFIMSEEDAKKTAAKMVTASKSSVFFL